MAEKKSLTTGIIIFLSLIVIGFLVVMGLTIFLSRKDYIGSQKVALVRVEGVIYNSRSVLKELAKYKRNPSVKAIVVRVNSPGGSVAPAQEIYQEIANICQEGKKKVVVSMAGIAASGGYYISCAADRIVANPGTITGSIGVIMEFANISELLKKIGLQTVTIKKGKHKDIGSPTREMSPQEKELLDELLTDVYQQFVAAIAESRELPLEEVRAIADGRILSGKQAKELGLVDELGNINYALELAADLSGIKERPLVVLEEEEGFIWQKLLQSTLLQVLAPEKFSLQPLSLQYIWR